MRSLRSLGLVLGLLAVASAALPTSAMAGLPPECAVSGAPPPAATVDAVRPMEMVSLRIAPLGVIDREQISGDSLTRGDSSIVVVELRAFAPMELLTANSLNGQRQRHSAYRSCRTCRWNATMIPTKLARRTTS